MQPLCTKLYKEKAGLIASPGNVNVQNQIKLYIPPSSPLNALFHWLSVVDNRSCQVEGY